MRYRLPRACRPARLQRAPSIEAQFVVLTDIDQRLQPARIRGTEAGRRRQLGSGRRLSVRLGTGRVPNLDRHPVDADLVAVAAVGEGRGFEYDVTRTAISPASRRTWRASSSAEQEVGYLAGYLAGLEEVQAGGKNTMARSAARSSPSTATSPTTRRARARSGDKSAAAPATVSGEPLVRPPPRGGGPLSRMAWEGRIGGIRPNLHEPGDLPSRTRSRRAGCTEGGADIVSICGGSHRTSAQVSPAQQGLRGHL